jgi:hypothetical protein
LHGGAFSLSDAERIVNEKVARLSGNNRNVLVFATIELSGDMALPLLLVARLAPRRAWAMLTARSAAAVVTSVV